MALAVQVPRVRVHDQKLVTVRTVPGGADKHTHCALMDDYGFGYTSPGPDGHTHAVDGCDVLAAAGHTHDLSAQRCDREHDRRVRHVE
ncbi:MAG TPA: hypothetical protein VE074_13890 [Jatrophihabitantaceae bacterium]|nr:hypothetical protein [Jatrophihabitantaceae bacterium]